MGVQLANICICEEVKLIYIALYNEHLQSAQISSNSTGTSFPVTSSRTCWRRRQLPRNKLATSYEEDSDTPDHLDMSRWSESRQLPRNKLATRPTSSSLDGDFPVTFATGKLRGNWSQWNLSLTVFFASHTELDILCYIDCLLTPYLISLPFCIVALYYCKCVKLIFYIHCIP